jgi:hypothetical protein
MKKILCLTALCLLMIAGIARAESVIRPEVDARVTGDSLGIGIGASLTGVAQNIVYADLKYVIMGSDVVDNKLQLGIGLNIIETLNALSKTTYESKNLFLRIGIGADVLDNLDIEYIASLAWRF